MGLDLHFSNMTHDPGRSIGPHFVAWVEGSALSIVSRTFVATCALCLSFCGCLQDAPSVQSHLCIRAGAAQVLERGMKNITVMQDGQPSRLLQAIRLPESYRRTIPSCQCCLCAEAARRHAHCIGKKDAMG